MSCKSADLIKHTRSLSGSVGLVVSCRGLERVARNNLFTKHQAQAGSSLATCFDVMNTHQTVLQPSNHGNPLCNVTHKPSSTLYIWRNWCDPITHPRIRWQPHYTWVEHGKTGTKNGVLLSVTWLNTSPVHQISDGEETSVVLSKGYIIRGKTPSINKSKVWQGLDVSLVLEDIWLIAGLSGNRTAVAQHLVTGVAIWQDLTQNEQ